MLDTAMSDAHWRLTPQRHAVLETLESATDHPTAAEVFERVRVSSPGIGPATVYRTLALLVRQRPRPRALAGRGHLLTLRRQHHPA